MKWLLTGSNLVADGTARTKLPADSMQSAGSDISGKKISLVTSSEAEGRIWGQEPG